MNVRFAATVVCGMLLAAAGALWLFDRQISGAWFRLGLQPGIAAALERSLADQKALARLAPERREELRSRFGETQTLLNHLRILEHNREEIVRRWELVLLAAVGGVLAVAGGAHLVRQSRLDARIERLRMALAALSAGQEDLEIGDRSRDTLGRIAAMIEETSRAIARDRKRLAYLKNLSVWQETARRHAHEMRTPLTAARLEVARLQQTLEEPGNLAEARQVAASIDEELERLGRFTQQFTSFARLPQPRLEVHDLGRAVEEFATTFTAAWPNLTLRLEPAGRPLPVALDREMLRQTLVNLCDNSSLALRPFEGRRGTVTLRLGEAGRTTVLDVADDGPGIPPEIRSRVFEPYVTTRRVGEGMGLGLAICKKILLDHGGDLEVRESGPRGTTFRLTFPRPQEEAA